MNWDKRKKFLKEHGWEYDKTSWEEGTSGAWIGQSGLISFTFELKEMSDQKFIETITSN